MEKLEKLLKEYAPNYCNDLPNDIIMDELVISKKFWFIKWLENENKIDYEKVRKWENSDSRWNFETCQPEYFMIMLLSIQDNPIDFLISLLK